MLFRSGTNQYQIYHSSDVNLVSGHTYYNSDGTLFAGGGLYYSDGSDYGTITNSGVYTRSGACI